MRKNNCRKYFGFRIILILSVCLFYTSNSFAEPDYWPTKGWRIASPESQGMDSSKLADMLDIIWEQEYRIKSIVVVRNGYLVLDAYSYPYDAVFKHHLFSCTKSITSALTGIAIDKGYIKGVTQPVLDFFPERVAENLEANKKAMTLEHLLTMTTGLECRDSHLYNWRGLYQMEASDDWVKFILDLPMVEAPGTRFEYCNGASFLLSAIVQKQTGMNTLSFAEKHLFNHLGISDIMWWSNQQGINFGHIGLFMRLHDMAKIGYLYLNDGLWDGKRIISSQWINASTRKHITAGQPFFVDYGYQWWIVSPGIYSAIGYGGQYIMVAPEKNIVAVFTGMVNKDFIPLDLFASYILPAVKSATSLPENPQGEKELKALSQRWQKTKPANRGVTSEKVDKSSQE